MGGTLTKALGQMAVRVNGYDRRMEFVVTTDRPGSLNLHELLREHANRLASISSQGIEPRLVIVLQRR